MTGIVGVTGVAPTGYLAPSTSRVSSIAGTAFGEAMVGAVEGLQDAQRTSAELAVKAVSGDLTDIHDATIASARSAVTLELVAAVRNKGVDAFTEIMRMQA
jgi:flagellar hook-basal body complex protein FliE